MPSTTPPASAWLFAHRVDIAKSLGKDWNQDLKQEQLRRVIKQELGLGPFRLK